MVTIEPYNKHWPIEFETLGQNLRHHLGELALRIDHIGSTSVPGLAAKDIIDIQITVEALTAEVETALNHAGYQRIERITQDHLPPGMDDDPETWRKWLFKPQARQRPTNVHVRLPGRANQRYALLFRDYLRAHRPIALGYAQVKIAVVKYHPEDDMDAYYDIKDPVCDIIIGGAEYWATTTGWQAPSTDC